MTTLFRGAVVLGTETMSKLTSVNTLADVGSVDVAAFRTKHLTFTATTNTLVAKILGSYDGGLTFPATVEAEFDVTTAAQVVKTITDFYTDLKVQVKPKVAATHGTLAVLMKAASF